MGALYWQLNDMWPAPSWASLDWKGNWKALHYMVKRFNLPLMISGVQDWENHTAQIHVTNDLKTEQTGKVEYTTGIPAVLEDTFPFVKPRGKVRASA
jgi:beta-mannosidase